MTHRPLALLSIASLALLLVGAESAQAQPKPVKAKVVSVRENRVYLQLDRERNFAEGQTIIIARGGESAKVRLVASSSKFLLISRPKKLRLEADQTVTVRAKASANATPEVKATPARRVAGGISIGRRAPSLQQFRAQPPPTRKLIEFRGLSDGDDGSDAEPREGGSGLPANDVRGSLEIGADGAYEESDAEGAVTRTTPYASLRLEVLRLFGSDRAKFVMYGTVRQPLQGSPDWATGRNQDELRARLTALALVLAPSHPDDLESFTDRIELNLGRDSVPDVIEAGIIDGAHIGLQVGPVTPFGFLGFAVSPNPRHEDYDTTTFGGGLRLKLASEEGSSLRLSAAVAQEVYKSQGDRGYAEANLDARVGSFGLRGSLVYDIFSSLRDEKRERITVAELSAYVQITDELRFSGGYSERRPVYTGALIQKDLSLLNDLTHLDEMPESPRVNTYAELTYAVARSWEVHLRGESYTSRESRNATGGVFGIALLDLLAHDRLSLDIAVRFRDRSPDKLTSASGEQLVETTQDTSARLGYRYLGDFVTWSLDVVWRYTSPVRYGELRYGGRFAAEINPTNHFALGGYAEAQIQEQTASDNTDLLLVGLYGRVSF